MNLKRISKISILSFLLAIAVLVYHAQSLFTVQRVVDGDTIILNTGEKVRLIGVDTPESVHPNKLVERFGKEASEFTRRMCEGKQVRLEYDWQKVDKYGRVLAYVFVLKSGKEIFLNAEIIKQGYGFAFLKYPFREDYMKSFREYERQVQEKGLVLWAGEDEEINEYTSKPGMSEQEATTVYITKTGVNYHREGCRYLSKSIIPISLRDAVNRGYTPCSVCRPPTLY